MPRQRYILGDPIFLLTCQTFPAALPDHLGRSCRGGLVLSLIFLLFRQRILFRYGKRQKQIEEHHKQLNDALL